MVGDKMLANYFSKGTFTKDESKFFGRMVAQFDGYGHILTRIFPKCGNGFRSRTSQKLAII
jgi:hypothetical protein